MCGIIGHFGTRIDKYPYEEITRNQLDQLRYRGPDEQGIYTNDHVVFGHNRLSIIDIKNGKQPMTTDDGELTIVFNGEIYNYVELAKILRSLGHPLKTQSDTEVILYGYREWGLELLPRLNGMFAFAIHDRTNQSIFCARDPYGQKPFYYLLHEGVFHFSSESSTFQHVPNFKYQINPEAIRDYLCFESFSDEASVWQGVRKLPPGHHITLDLKLSLKVSRYWRSLPKFIDCSSVSPDDSTQELLQQAIRRTYRGDVPIAILLSGGLDSSLVLGLTRALFPKIEIQTFHVRFGEANYDESQYAVAAAKHFQAPLKITEIGLNELATLASAVPALLDEPQADPGILPKYRICAEIAKTHKVALTGDGADEFFYGYLTFKAQQLARFYSRLPNFFQSSIVPQIVNFLPSQSGYMRLDFLAKNFIRGFPSDEATRNLKWIRSFSQLQSELILRTPVSQRSAALQLLKQIDLESENCGSLGRHAYKYQRMYLPDYVLANSDRASMLNSIELRAPLLDLKLVQHINKLSDSEKMKKMETKFLLKRLASRYLPKNLIYRKKMGFTAPIAKLIQGPLRVEIEDIFSESLLIKQNIFNYAPIRDLLSRHFSGDENLYKPIWTLYALQKWFLSRGIR